MGSVPLGSVNPDPDQAELFTLDEQLFAAQSWGLCVSLIKDRLRTQARFSFRLATTDRSIRFRCFCGARCSVGSAQN